MIKQSSPIESVCLIGAGILGMQIGLHCAVHGYAVSYFDNQDSALKRAAEGHVHELGVRLEARQISVDEKESILSRIRFAADMEEAVIGAHLVIEAVSEQLAIKREVFTQLDQICPKETILATNSSSIRVSAIEDATGRPDRVLNMHFYNPVWQRPVVELMRGSATSDETISFATEFIRSIDVTPLIVQVESIGFLFNRVWRAIKKECLHLVDEGVASFEDVDRAWMIAMESNVGPFGRMDRVGLDVVRDIELVYYRESGDEADAPPKILLDKIERGELGLKTGRGFYSYPNPAYRDPDWLKNDHEY